MAKKTPSKMLTNQARLYAAEAVVRNLREGSYHPTDDFYQEVLDQAFILYLAAGQDPNQWEEWLDGLG